MEDDGQNQPPKPATVPGKNAGVLIRADNGDVITYDETGLTLRLSDTVLADLQRRLSMNPDTEALLGDIDAWNIRREGDWLKFSAQLDRNLPPRDYQRAADGGDIIAAAPGPIYAILGLGGPRRAGFNDAPAAFRHHVLAPGDHIGGVGLEGTARAEATETLQYLPYATREALIADTLLDWRRAAQRSLPHFLVRAETDSSADIAALACGEAYANFLVALDNLNAIAARLGKAAKVLAVGLDYSLEDRKSDPATYAEGMRGLMRQIERDMGQRGLQRPIFLMNFETGTERIGDHASIRGQWELAWSHSTHLFAFAAPGYMFEVDRFGRPTDDSRTRMAEMDAHAIVALSARENWSCPLFLLAEQEGTVIRVTAESMSDLVLDAADPFAAGPDCGFAVTCTDRPVTILSVRLADDDTKTILVECDSAPEGDMAELRYAYGGSAGAMNRGAVRDSWSVPSRAGEVALHRWALPAILPIRRGAA
ncbi:MAG: hypothetical protein KDE08_03235 [Rhodobacteraceae bacterium]|nr:hypothetical protein [Paracoccaceae bacterium]